MKLQRGIAKLLVMTLSVVISLFIGVVVARGDPRNPFREVTALELAIEDLMKNLFQI